MARKRERAFAAFGAALFLLTSSALTIAVIYTLVNQNKQSSDASATNQAKETSMNSNPAQLQGTKLANFTPMASISQLQEVDTAPGNGAVVKPGDTVTIDYTGAVASTGVIFQSSKDTGQPVPLTLKSGPQGVIEGFAQGLPGMKIGGTRRLLIPAALAYGSHPPQGSGIPANADLVFDVTLHKIGQ